MKASSTPLQKVLKHKVKNYKQEEARRLQSGSGAGKNGCSEKRGERMVG